MASSESSSSFPLGPHTLPTPRLTLRTPTVDLLPALAAYWPGQTPEAELANEIQKWDQTRAEGVNAWLVVVLKEDEVEDSVDCGGEKKQEQEQAKIIGFGGYNSLPRTTVEGADDKVLVADMGIEINAKYQRKVGVPPPLLLPGAKKNNRATPAKPSAP